MEQRANQNRDAKGRWASTGARMGTKEVTRVSSQIATDFPSLKPKEIVSYANRNHLYDIEVVEFGTYIFKNKIKIR